MCLLSARSWSTLCFDAPVLCAFFCHTQLKYLYVLMRLSSLCLFDYGSLDTQISIIEQFVVLPQAKGIGLFSLHGLVGNGLSAVYVIGLFFGTIFRKEVETCVFIRWRLSGNADYCTVLLGCAYSYTHLLLCHLIHWSQLVHELVSGRCCRSWFYRYAPIIWHWREWREGWGLAVWVCQVVTWDFVRNPLTEVVSAYDCNFRNLI